VRHLSLQILVGFFKQLHLFLFSHLVALVQNYLKLFLHLLYLTFLFFRLAINIAYQLWLEVGKLTLPSLVLVIDGVIASSGNLAQKNLFFLVVCRKLARYWHFNLLIKLLKPSTIVLLDFLDTISKQFLFR
jgi:hypothetical protein